MGEEKKKKRREEEEEKRRRRNHGMKCLELLYGIICWNCLEHVWNSCLGQEFFKPNSLSICRLGKTLTYKCVIWLFGLVGILNGGKICIEKMLGFRGEAICFF